MTSEAALPDLPANRGLLDHLRAYACRPSGPDDYALAGWQLHTHPDLMERLAELAPAGCPVVPVFGVPVLAADGVAAVVALGTSWLVVRLPEVPPGIALAAPIPPLTDQGWRAVGAWQGELPTPEGTRRLAELIVAALSHAGHLSRAGQVDEGSPKDL